MLRFIVIPTLLLFFLFPAPQASAQLGLGIFKKKTRVKLTPTNKSYRLEGEEITLQEGYFNEQERWIVFSDRAANITYKEPGSEIQVKVLGFMDPCYVIGRDGGYFELVKYNAGLIKEGAKGKIDRKSAEYLGWVHKSHLLLWRTALKENNSKFYVKAVTSIKNEQAFPVIARYAIADSLLLYSGPALKDTMGKCRMEDLFYLFKQSDDGKQYLIGRTPQIIADNQNKAVSGWISRDLVRLWGTRPYILPPDVVEKIPAAKHPRINFYADSARAIRPDSTVPLPLYTPQSATLAGNPLESIYPVQAVSDLSDSTSIIRTSVLTDVLDRSENEVINVLGKKVLYADFQRIVSSQQKINLVFVMDGGRENGKYLPNMLTLLQNLEVFFDTSRTFRHFSYGAVVYKDNMTGSCRTSALPLTREYSQVVRFFYERQQETDRCNNDTVAQAMFSGLSEAAKMLAAHRDESNIVILVGAAGDNQDGRVSYADVIGKLSYARARMIFFQTHSIPHPSYNDFVIQARNIVQATAANISELKKEKLVDLKDVLENPSFSLAKGDSGFYYLDFPARSMTQGYVMFPQKGALMTPYFLEKALDSLMRKMNTDNEHIALMLNHYFSTIGIRNTRVLPPYQYYYPSYGNSYLPVDFLKAGVFAGTAFSIPAWTVYKDFSPDSLKTTEYGILLSADEYSEVRQALYELGGNKDYSNEKRRIIYNHLYSVVSGYLSLKSIEIDERISRLSLAESLEWLTGYRSVNPLWNAIELRMIKDEDKIKKEDVIAFMNACKRAAVWMQENENSNKLRFFNNGQAYYLLHSSDFLTDKQ